MSGEVIVDYARLEHDDLGVFDLTDNGRTFMTASLDLGWPEPREVVNSRSGLDGEDDDTLHHDGRVVSFEGAAWKPASSAVDLTDKLASFTRPGLRPWLIYKLRDAEERRIKLRASRFSRPIQAQKPGIITVGTQWRAPDGVAESTAVEDHTLNPSETVGGRTYDLTFDRSYPASTGPGRLDVANDGTAPAYPLLKVFGPVTDPIVENETAGRKLQFSLSIADGDYLEVDTLERTILLNGLEGSSQYDALDFAASRWWSLAPKATSRVRFTAATHSSPAVCELVFRRRYL